jgi:hypothetical protein
MLPWEEDIKSPTLGKARQKEPKPTNEKLK